jgi:hypothetical protein
MNTNTKPELPKAFLDVFTKLVSRTQSGRLEAGTAAAYYELLQRVPLHVLIESATRLAETHTFFPSVAEWLHAAAAVSPPAVRTCDHCHATGLVRVCYHSGEPFDVAICDCAAGQFYRTVGEETVRTNLDLGAEHQVAYREDFEEATA